MMPPPEVIWALNLVGLPWPELDEDKARAAAQAWTDAMAGVLDIAGTGNASATGVNFSVQSVSVEAFNDYWTKWTDGADSYLGQLANQARQLAALALDTSARAEEAKWEIILELVVLTAILLIDIALAPETLGASIAEAGLSVLLTRVVIMGILRRLLFAIAAAVLPDAITQGIQLVNGHRSSPDGGRLLADAGQGLLFGGLMEVAGIGGQLAIGRFAPKLLTTAGGRVTFNMATGATAGGAFNVIMQKGGSNPLDQALTGARTGSILGLGMGLGSEFVRGQTARPTIEPSTQPLLDPPVTPAGTDPVFTSGNLIFQATPANDPSAVLPFRAVANPDGTLAVTMTIGDVPVGTGRISGGMLALDSGRVLDLRGQTIAHGGGTGLDTGSTIRIPAGPDIGGQGGAGVIPGSGVLPGGGGGGGGGGEPVPSGGAALTSGGGSPNLGGLLRPTQSDGTMTGPVDSSGRAGVAVAPPPADLTQGQVVVTEQPAVTPTADASVFTTGGGQRPVSSGSLPPLASGPLGPLDSGPLGPLEFGTPIAPPASQVIPDGLLNLRRVPPAPLPGADLLAGGPTAAQLPAMAAAAPVFAIPPPTLSAAPPITPTSPTATGPATGLSTGPSGPTAAGPRGPTATGLSTGPSGPTATGPSAGTVGLTATGGGPVLGSGTSIGPLPAGGVPAGQPSAAATLPDRTVSPAGGPGATGGHGVSQSGPVGAGSTTGRTGPTGPAEPAGPAGPRTAPSAGAAPAGAAPVGSAAGPAAPPLPVGGTAAPGNPAPLPAPPPAGQAPAGQGPAARAGSPPGGGATPVQPARAGRVAPPGVQPAQTSQVAPPGAGPGPAAAGPAAPAGAAGPPATPAAPVEPAAPLMTAEPVPPVEPVAPQAPATPRAPVMPAEPFTVPDPGVVRSGGFVWPLAPQPTWIAPQIRWPLAPRPEWITPPLPPWLPPGWSTDPAPAPQRQQPPVRQPAPDPARQPAEEPPAPQPPTQQPPAEGTPAAQPAAPADRAGAGPVASAAPHRDQVPLLPPPDEPMPGVAESTRALRRAGWVVVDTSYAQSRTDPPPVVDQAQRRRRRGRPGAAPPARPPEWEVSRLPEGAAPLPGAVTGLSAGPGGLPRYGLRRVETRPDGSTVIHEDVFIEGALPRRGEKVVYVLRARDDGTFLKVGVTNATPFVRYGKNGFTEFRLETMPEGLPQRLHGTDLDGRAVTMRIIARVPRAPRSLEKLFRTAWGGRGNVEGDNGDAADGIRAEQQRQVLLARKQFGVWLNQQIEAETRALAGNPGSIPPVFTLIDVEAVRTAFPAGEPAPAGMANSRPADDHAEPLFDDQGRPIITPGQVDIGAIPDPRLVFFGAMPDELFAAARDLAIALRPDRPATPLPLQRLLHQQRVRQLLDRVEALLAGMHDGISGQPFETTRQAVWLGAVHQVSDALAAHPDDQLAQQLARRIAVGLRDFTPTAQEPPAAGTPPRFLFQAPRQLWDFRLQAGQPQPGPPQPGPPQPGQPPALRADTSTAAAVAAQAAAQRQAISDLQPALAQLAADERELAPIAAALAFVQQLEQRRGTVLTEADSALDRAEAEAGKPEHIGLAIKDFLLRQRESTVDIHVRAARDGVDEVRLIDGLIQRARLDGALPADLAGTVRKWFGGLGPGGVAMVSDAVKIHRLFQRRGLAELPQVGLPALAAAQQSAAVAPLRRERELTEEVRGLRKSLAQARSSAPPEVAARIEQEIEAGETALARTRQALPEARRQQRLQRREAEIRSAGTQSGAGRTAAIGRLRTEIADLQAGLRLALAGDRPGAVVHFGQMLADREAALDQLLAAEAAYRQRRSAQRRLIQQRLAAVQRADNDLATARRLARKALTARAEGGDVRTAKARLTAAHRRAKRSAAAADQLRDDLINLESSRQPLLPAVAQQLAATPDLSPAADIDTEALALYAHRRLGAGRAGELAAEVTVRDGFARQLDQLAHRLRQRAALAAVTAPDATQRAAATRLNREIDELRDIIAGWALTGPDQVPAPPRSVREVRRPIPGPTGRPVPGQTALTEVPLSNVESWFTAPGDPLSWAGIRINASPRGNRFAVRRRSPDPYGKALPIETHVSNVYTVTLADGTTLRVSAREDFHRVELNSATELFRWNGSLQPDVVFPGFPWAQVIPIPVPFLPGYNILLIPRAYATIENGLLLPGSDDVFDQPGRRQIKVTKMWDPHGSTMPDFWQHQERGGRTELSPTSPGPRLAPQFAWNVGVGGLLVVPIVLPGIGQVGATGLVVQWQFTNENKYQVPVRPGAGRPEVGWDALARHGELEPGTSVEQVISQFIAINHPGVVPQPGAAFPQLFGGWNFSGVNWSNVDGIALGPINELPGKVLGWVSKVPILGRPLDRAFTRLAAPGLRAIQAARDEQAQHEQDLHTDVTEWEQGVNLPPALPAPAASPTPILGPAGAPARTVHAPAPIDAGTAHLPLLATTPGATATPDKYDLGLPPPDPTALPYGQLPVRPPEDFTQPYDLGLPPPAAAGQTATPSSRLAGAVPTLALRRRMATALNVQLPPEPEPATPTPTATPVANTEPPPEPAPPEPAPPAPASRRREPPAPLPPDQPPSGQPPSGRPPNNRPPTYQGPDDEHPEDPDNEPSAQPREQSGGPSFVLAEVANHPAGEPVYGDLGEVSPEDLLTKWGMPLATQRGIAEVAAETGATIRMRTSGKETPRLLDEGLWPKPKPVKAKTVNKLDIPLGFRPEDVGKVGYREPIEPDNPSPPLQARYQQRLAEFNDLAATMKALADPDRVMGEPVFTVDEHGIVNQVDEDGVAHQLTGDQDTFDITGPDGLPLSDASQRMVINLLKARNIGILHESHMYWMPPPAEEGIFQGVINKHLSGGADEPLVVFRPGAQPRLEKLVDFHKHVPPEEPPP